MGTPGNVLIGPGDLYVAPIGTAEPASATAILNAAFRLVGYTEDGTTFNYEITTEDILVAEEFDPVMIATTGRTGSVAFQMAEATRQNLALALNAGADAATSGTLEPPDPGSEVRVMILLQTEEGARWLFRRCLQSGSIEIQRDKAPAKALLPVTFKLEKPSGAKPFIVWPSLSTAGVV
jgi:hypothetical protein